MSQFSFGAAAPGGAFGLGAPRAAATAAAAGFSFSAPASTGFSFGSAAPAAGGGQPAGLFSFSRPGTAAQPAGFSFGSAGAAPAAPAAAAFPLGSDLCTAFNSSHQYNHSNNDHKHQPGTHPVLWNQAWSYKLAENIDAQLKRMAQDLKDIIDHLNTSGGPADSSDPLQQICKILNAHMDSLQWIDQNSAVLQRKVEEVTKVCESRRKEQERSFRITFD
ncbi:Nuclear pore glycoprotein p62 [Lonchura striata]|uniref:Nuclear pore glycoprotein p62 n=1 Tax=Lonchura striata TaxID=40157 RepID=A0A218UKP0_9PASE|nr:Nuclear pore glycoprotein p62 [Lonchura striata domestica]